MTSSSHITTTVWLSDRHLSLLPRCHSGQRQSPRRLQSSTLREHGRPADALPTGRPHCCCRLLLLLFSLCLLHAVNARKQKIKKEIKRNSKGQLGIRKYRAKGLITQHYSERGRGLKTEKSIKKNKQTKQVKTNEPELCLSVCEAVVLESGSQSRSSIFTHTPMNLQAPVQLLQVM